MSLAAHEANHAAMAMVLGMEVLEARVDDPTPRAAGHVIHAPGDGRDDALVTLAGRMGDDGWPPAWPPRSDRSTDERHLAEYVQAASLDETGWASLCADAERLVATPSFVAKKSVVEALLDHGCVLDREKLRQIDEAVEDKPRLERKTVEASARPTTDLGEFSAIAAAYTQDRQNDRIVPGAFEKTVARWRASGKRVPLHWNHGAKAEDVIGTVDPRSMREMREGLYVRGKLDLDDSAVAREAWRSMKANAISVSFGYTAPGSRKRRDGIRELTEIDLFEVSLTPQPANPDTRILEMKSTEPPSRTPYRPREEGEAPSMADLRKQAAELGLTLPMTRTERRKTHSPARPFSLLPEGWDDWRPRRRIRDLDPEEVALRELRRESDRIALHAALGWDQELIRRMGA
jgi:Escherichia/Staphylococcus phage prohead protease